MGVDMETTQEPGEKPLLAGIDASGKEYVCAIATDPAEPLLKTRFPIGDPEATVKQAITFFHDAAQSYGSIRSMGIGTFGPADIHARSPGYGSILTTPKEGWAGFNIVNTIRDGLGKPIPIAFDIAVNTAVLAETEYGNGANHRYVAYLTVGTGIGASFLYEGQIIHGRMHPEVGHMAVPNFDQAVGKNLNLCPFHESCFEGRATRPAIEARWESDIESLPDDHEAWALEAAYLAAGCINLTAVWSPDLILLGGDIPQSPGLIELVRREFKRQAGNYWNLPPLDLYLQTPALNQNAGIVGALILAKRLL